MIYISTLQERFINNSEVNMCVQRLLFCFATFSGCKFSKLLHFYDY